MFLKKASQDEFVAELERNLKHSNATPMVEKIARQAQAVKHLLVAAELFDEIGLPTRADEITSLLATFAWEVPQQNPPSSEEMLRNLEDHGTVFPMPTSDVVPSSALHGEKTDLVPGKAEKHVEHQDSVPSDSAPSESAPKTKQDEAEARTEHSSVNQAELGSKDGEILEVVAPDKEEEVELQPEGDIEVSDENNKATATE